MVGARYYNPELSIWLSVDPLAEKYPSTSAYMYCAGNPVMLVDPDGAHIDPTELLKNSDHIAAAILFAQSKEGKEFLDKYASKGQKFEYNGKVIYEAKKAGEYDKKGINLIFKIGVDEEASSVNSNISSKNGYKYDITVDIAKNGFGSGNKIFNISKAIVHECFMHVDFSSNDMLDDGLINNSGVPDFYQQYKNHADHYYVSREFNANNASKDVQLFPTSGFNVLKQISNNLKLNYSDSQVKSIMWNFNGSLLNVNQKGNLIYKK